jgi:hypothetical protein
VSLFEGRQHISNLSAIVTGPSFLISNTTALCSRLRNLLYTPNLFFRCITVCGFQDVSVLFMCGTKDATVLNLFAMQFCVKFDISLSKM